MTFEAWLFDGPANGREYTLPGPRDELIVAEPSHQAFADLSTLTEAEAASPVPITQHRYVAYHTVTYYRPVGSETT